MHIFKIYEEADLLEYLGKYVAEKGIKTAWINIMGSLIDPVIGYYDTDKGEYTKKELPGFYELVNGTGNVSLKEGKPFIHLHVAVADREGNLYGGHLFGGKVFLVEALIIEVIGAEPLQREKVDGNLWVWMND